MIDVVSSKLMRDSDKATIENRTPSKELMYKAALGVFNNVKWFGNIAIFAGKGNNAGDGYALSLILKEHGYNPEIILLEESFSEDGLFYFDKCKKENIKISKFDKDNEYKFDIVVDAILGTGFKGEVKENIKEMIETINLLDSYVVSIDINSGLSADTGLCDIAIKSDLTISIGSFKYGHFLGKAKDYMKDKINVDIGIDLIDKDIKLINKEDIKTFFKERNNYSNKGTYGYVGIMGGSSKYAGAVKLAHLGLSSLYTGSGVSRVIIPDVIAKYLYPETYEITLYPMKSISGHFAYDEEEIKFAIKGLRVLAIGPGIENNIDTQNIIKFLIKETDITLVIDADAINALSNLDLSILNESKAKIILTPHLKEFSRLTKLEVKDIESNIVDIAKAFVNKYNVTLLLKGTSTLILNKDNIYITDTGCSGMATAGSGDVLTGIITGILSYQNDDITYSVAVSSYINGLAGELASKKYTNISMTSKDTAEAIREVIKDL